LVCESGRNPSRLVDRLVGGGLVERVVAAEDRRRVTVSLTSTGREMEAAVRTVEKRLYLDLDTAAAGLDLGPALKILRALSARQPAGNALERRVDALRTHDNLPGAL
jgi:DNA-binding MarR family transcriptional regulator